MRVCLHLQKTDELAPLVDNLIGTLTHSDGLEYRMATGKILNVSPLILSARHMKVNC